MTKPKLIGTSLSLTLLTLSLIILALPALADTTATTRQTSQGTNLVFGGRPADAAKTVVVDTQLIMGPWGSGAPYNGQFQTPDGFPAWNGWTSVDLTQSDVTHWQADTYHAVRGTYSAWCGDASYPMCPANDPGDGGYGNSWKELLVWRGTVANPALPCTVTINALVNHDSETGYDYSYLSVEQDGTTINLWTADGTGTQVPVSTQIVYLPGEYEGLDNDQVVVKFRFESDGGWSDADCSYGSVGAIQVDDVQISLSNGTGYSHDFEDGTLGQFVTEFPPGVGDFAKIWSNLRVAPGAEAGDRSPKVAFIDDGLVVPGTGGTPCLEWCYGPGGYVVNHSGGLAGPGAHIKNMIRSPIMAWPDPTYDGSDFSFDAWRHESLAPNSAGIFFIWSIRSTADPDTSALGDGNWLDRNFVYYGGPDWFRLVNPVGDITEPNARWVQVEIGVYELGWAWGWAGSNSTPAPYFDNVRLTAFPYYGPTLSATVTHLPHDNFPESGAIDLVNLANNNVRFDMGRNLDLARPATFNTPGDSIVISVVPQRDGAVLHQPPRLHWRLQNNPLFDAYRTAGLGNSGYTEGWQVMRDGTPLPNRYAFDLPDSGFLFPGDFLYYYFEASDVVDGEVQTLIMPADTTGYSNFADPMAYPPIYKLHALPSLHNDPGPATVIVQPEILFWDDASAIGNRDEWYSAFAQLGLVAGVDYDIYYTNNPVVSAGHGLGGRATAAQLRDYQDLIYTAGVVGVNTLSSGPDEFTNDAGDDVGVITAWLEQGNKDLLLTGDDIAGDLFRGTAAQNTFLSDWMGLALVEENVLEFIDVQTDPLIEPIAGNPVFQSIAQWRGVASNISTTAGYYGGGSLVTGTKRYDGVELLPGAARLAEFLNPAGHPGQYTFSAATLNVRADHNVRVISFPYDLQSIWDAGTGTAKTDAPLSTRALILGDVLTFFGQTGGTPTNVPAAEGFGVQAYPNPFNPKTTISYNLPRAGHLSLKVFDVRGRMVNTLIDGHQAAGHGQIQWDGRATDGSTAATGVYFYEARIADESLVGKMMLLK